MQNIRKSNRHRHYDYSLPGFYFVTICTERRKEYFGKIENGKVKLNQLGRIVSRNLENILEYFDNVFLDAHIVMPNHIHAIFEIRDNPVGADLASDQNNPVGADLASARTWTGARPVPTNVQKQTGARPVPTTKGGLLSEVVRVFKSKSAMECLKFSKENELGRLSKIWQRSLYDHIIRNQNSLNKIRQYIQRNPKFWEEDKNKVENIFY